MNMATWKKEIRQLCRDFLVPMAIYESIVRKTEERCRQNPMPNYYNGNKDDYCYETAWNSVRPFITY